MSGGRFTYIDWGFKYEHRENIVKSQREDKAKIERVSLNFSLVWMQGLGACLDKVR
jgi:hypothetical protein